MCKKTQPTHKFYDNQTSAKREDNKNLTLVVRCTCITQRKFVSKKKNKCKCSGTYRKNVQRQILKDCVLNLTNIVFNFQKSR